MPRSLLFAAALFLIVCQSAIAAQILFNPSLHVSETYTDNLYLEPENEEDEFITTAGIDLVGSILWRTAGMSLSYRPAYLAYKENDQLNNWRHQAGLNIWNDFTRNTRLEIQNNYLRTNEPISSTGRQGLFQGPVFEFITNDPADESQIYEGFIDRNRRGRREYHTNTALARLTHQFGAADTIYAAYQYSIYEDIESIEGAPVIDNRVSTPSIGLNYNFTPRWGLQSNASYAISDYVDRPDRDEFNAKFRLLHHFNRVLSGFLNYRHTILDYSQEGGEDYQVYAPSIGFDYSFQENARIELALGYYIQDFESSGSNEGFYITSNIHKRWLYRGGSFRISGGSGYVIDDKGVEDNSLNIYYRIGADAGYRFAQKLSGSVHASFRYDDYPDAPIEQNQNTTSAGAGLNFQALRWMVLGLSYTFTTVNSSGRINEYTENRVMLTARVAPITPYRLN